MNTKRVNLVFNLNIEDHKEAYELLQKFNNAKTSYVVQAILKYNDAKIDQDTITEALKIALNTLDSISFKQELSSEDSFEESNDISTNQLDTLLNF